METDERKGKRRTRMSEKNGLWEDAAGPQEAR